MAPPGPPPRRYEWANGVHVFPGYDKADANAIGWALQAIADANGGRLEPDKAIAAARSRSHPLYPHLTWDDKVAGQRWRIQELRTITRALRLVGEPDEEGEPTLRRAWLSIEDNGVSYRGVEEVLSSQSLQVAVMKKALADLKAWEERYRDLDDICALVRAARMTLASRLSGQSAGPTPPS